MDFDLSSADYIVKYQTHSATASSIPFSAHMPWKTRESQKRREYIEKFAYSLNASFLSEKIYIAGLSVPKRHTLHRQTVGLKRNSITCAMTVV
jgi:hypothetical protein